MHGVEIYLFIFNLYFKLTDTKPSVCEAVRILILKSNPLERGKNDFRFIGAENEREKNDSVVVVFAGER